MIREERCLAIMEVGLVLHLHCCQKSKIDLDSLHMLDIVAQGPEAGVGNVLVVVVDGEEGDMSLQPFAEDQGSRRLDTTLSRFLLGIEQRVGS